MALAKAFGAHPKQATQAAANLATQVLDLTADDLPALLAQGVSPESLKEQGILSYLEVRGTPRSWRRPGPLP